MHPTSILPKDFVGPAVTAALNGVVPLDAPWWWPALALLLALALMSPLASGRWGAFLGVTHFGVYPPLWVSALIGLSAVFAALGWIPGIAATFGIDNLGQALIRNHFELGFRCELGLVVVLAVVSLVWPHFRKREPVQQAATGGPEYDLPPPERLIAWVRDDNPISSPSSDLFGHLKIAERIARRLATTDCTKAPSMAVIGELGSGKTSIFALVRDLTKARRRQRLVRVELWSYETPEAALEGIIRALVSALRAEVGVPELHGLPREYLQLVAGGGGFWSTLPGVFGTPSNPRDVINGIDRVAIILGFRFVLWLEDLERFASGAARSVKISAPLVRCSIL